MCLTASYFNELFECRLPTIKIVFSCCRHTSDFLRWQQQCRKRSAFGCGLKCLCEAVCRSLCSRDQRTDSANSPNEVKRSSWAVKTKSWMFKNTAFSLNSPCIILKQSALSFAFQSRPIKRFKGNKDSIVKFYFNKGSWRHVSREYYYKMIWVNNKLVFTWNV